MFNQIGKCDTFSVATPAITLTDIVSSEWSVDPELDEHVSGSSHFGAISIGQLNCSIKVTTTDASAYQAFVKGMEVKTVTVEYKPTVTDIDPSDMSLTSTSTGSIKYVISCARVMEAVVLTVGADKTPSQYSLTFKAMRDKATGADPTITPTMTLATTPEV